MATTTKLELQQLLAKAQAEVIALRTRISELEGDVAARDNRIANAIEAYKALRAERAAQPIVHRSAAPQEPVRTTYVKQGVMYEKVRIGNRAVHRVVATANA